MLHQLVLSVFFIGYQENAKYILDKNCLSCSRHKIVCKLSFLNVKMTQLVKKYKTVMNVACKLADLSVKMT